MSRKADGDRKSNLNRRWTVAWATPLALCGVLLPYVVALLPIVLFRQKIQSLDFYYAGKLAALDTATGWLTAAAILLGAALCRPWLQSRERAAKSELLWCFEIVALALIQFVTVFAARLWFYLANGGTFP